MNVEATASTTIPTQATLTWGRPNWDGDSAILAYKASCVSTPGGVVVGPETFPYGTTKTGTFTNLQPTTSYVCTEMAVNDVGSSIRSKPSNLFTTM